VNQIHHELADLLGPKVKLETETALRSTMPRDAADPSNSNCLYTDNTGNAAVPDC